MGGAPWPDGAIEVRDRADTLFSFFRFRVSLGLPKGSRARGDGSAVSVNVTFFSSFDLRPAALRVRIQTACQSDERCRTPEKNGPQVNVALLTQHSDGPSTEHRLTVTMAPGASSDCTKA